MSPRAAALLLLAAAPAALAQSSAVTTLDASRGVTLLPGSAAWADDATAAVYNPAGLSHAGALDAWYLHERSNTRGLDGDAVYLATAPGDVVGLGLSLEWLRAPGAPTRRKTALSLSAGGEGLSIGANLNWWRFGPGADPVSLDLGLQSRPTRWLSLGLLARNLNAPAEGGVAFAREVTLGLGLRPIGERLTIGVDWVAPLTKATDGRLQYTLLATVLPGLRVLGGVSHGFTGAAPLFFQAGLGVDLENVGYTQGVAFDGGRANWQFALRASADPRPSIVPRSDIAVVSLGDVGASGGSTLGSLLGVGAEDRYLRLLRFLSEAADDSALKGVVLKVEGSGLGLARAEEVRAAVLHLRASGKKVYAYILSAGDAEYLMVSACDGIYAAPEAMLLVDGLQSAVTFLGEAAESLGVHLDVARVGRFKNSPDQLTRRDMSPEQREALDAWLDTAARTIAAHVTADRKLTEAAWASAIDEGLKPTRRAEALRQIDGVLTPKAFDDLLAAKLPGATVSRDYRPFDERTGEWSRRPAIAVVPVLGNISGGRSTPSPLGGALVAGAESVIEQLSRAAADPRVKAIVLRVDSGGGDGLASDLMYRAVLEAKKRKPVIASMGDVAASGGYYAAMGADRVFASPTTLTGSIGVFFMKPALEELAHKLGVNQESLSRGAQVGVTGLYSPWTPAQREAAQRWVDDFYDTFITEVAASRKLDKAAVHEVAQGRVWSGADAKAHGLVDELGGLSDALAEARRRAGLGDDVDVIVTRDRPGLLGSLLQASTPSVLERPMEAPGASSLVQRLARQLGPAALLLERPAVQAALEYQVQID